MWIERLIGVVLFGLVVLLVLGALSHRVPDAAGQFLTVQARMFDSLRPYLIALAVGLAVVLLALGQGRLALLGLGAAGAIALGMIVDYASRIAPKAERGNLSLIWFNMLGTNTIAPDVLANALRQADVDVIILAEANPARRVPELLSDSHPHRLGCTDAACGLMILSRVPIAFSRLRDLPSGRERFARVVIDPPDHPATHLLVMHMVKPWFGNLAATENEALEAALNSETVPPTILVGDFNAAPWSRRLRHVEQTFGFEHPPFPIATWPVEAGPFGLPIDHVLLRGGTALAQIEPWGADLGSNHRGLRVSIGLPPV